METLRTGRVEALVRAACSGDLGMARGLLAGDGSLARGSFYAACACGEVGEVEMRLARSPGLAREAGGPLGWTPILYACFSRFMRGDRERARGVVRVVEALLKRGADPDSHYVVNHGGKPQRQTALFGAAGVANDVEITRMLLDAGADVDELEGDPAGEGWEGLGTEALYHASEFEDVGCLRLLLAARPHPRRVSYCFARVLDFANPEGAMLYLEAGADPNFRVPWMANRTHLQRAVRLGRAREVVEAMIERGGDVNAADSAGVSVYRDALRFGEVELARVLEARGARTEGVTEEERWLADFSAPVPPLLGRASVERLCRAAQRGQVEVVTRLLDAGVSANGCGEDGLPALHAACWRGQLGAARVLAERGADLHAKNRYGGDALGTTIHGSANCFDVEGGPGMKVVGEEVRHGDYAGVVRMLVEKGARVPGEVRGGNEGVREVLRGLGVVSG